MSQHRHIMPIEDIEHEACEDCACGPTPELARNDDGTDAGWLHSHHSLDGRELAET